MTTSRSTAQQRFTLVALVVPAVLTLVSLVVQLFALPHVPSTIAIHWGANGQPDGFGPAWLQLVLAVVVGFGVPLLIALMALPGLRRGDRGPSYRLLGAVAAAMSALMAVLMSWTLVAQVGLTDPKDAPSVLPALAVGFAAAALVGLAAWFLQPKAEPLNVTSTPAEGLVLSPGEHAAWFGATAMVRGGLIAIGIACVAISGGAIFSWFAGAPIVLTVVLGVVGLIFIVAAFTTTVFHVRVDVTGLSVASPLGFPRFHVPLSDIRSVEVSDVSPLGEFGGYGIRSTIGAFGVVLRRGSAITVTRTSGRRFVVTVDDASRGAALLEALVRRESQPDR